MKGKRIKRLKIKKGKQIKNSGSSVIEITLLIPIFLGCIFFYIIAVLFFVHQAEYIGQAAFLLYQKKYSSLSQDGSGDIAAYDQGNMECIDVLLEEYGMKAELKYKRNSSDIVRSLRRWQLVADTVQQRRN